MVLEFENLLPLACAWAKLQEQRIFGEGVSLTSAQLEDARCIGVRQPERVRLLQVAQIPSPSHPALIAASEAAGFGTQSALGLALRYGIYLCKGCKDQRSLIVHELVHTMQYERLGSFETFLAQYLRESLVAPGYPFGALEQEARRVEYEMRTLR